MTGTLPVVDERLCTGSGDCVRACPTDCLEMVGALPWLPRPQDCAACGVCVDICPVNAIRLERPTAA